jgi:hypothetical protein
MFQKIERDDRRQHREEKQKNPREERQLSHTSLIIYPNASLWNSGCEEVQSSNKVSYIHGLMSSYPLRQLEAYGGGSSKTLLQQ